MQTDLPKMRLLIAAGESVLRRILSHVLKDAGYWVSIAKNGVEALFIFNTFLETQKSFDILIFDLNLPEINCIDLVKRLEKCAARVPIIIISPHTTEMIRKNFPPEMNLHFVETPFSKEELLTMIQQVTVKEKP